MKSALHRFVEQIIRQTDCNREEREDLYEELLSHVEEAFMEYRKHGYSDEEALRTVMTNFGDKQEIGKQLQQAMYPYRREMLIVLSISSMLFTYSVYIFQLFLMGDAHILWMVSAVLISTGLLFVTVRPVAALNRRIWMNGLLLVHLFVFFYGLSLATDLTAPYSTWLTVIALLLMLLSIVLVYRTTIYDFPSNRQPLKKDAKRLHFINLTTGFVVVLVSLFFLWAFLLFGASLWPAMLWIIVPIGIWILSYAVQMQLLAKRKKRLAYAVVSIQTGTIAACLGYWLLSM